MESTLTLLHLVLLLPLIMLITCITLRCMQMPAVPPSGRASFSSERSFQESNLLRTRVQQGDRFICPPCFLRMLKIGSPGVTIGSRKWQFNQMLLEQVGMREDDFFLSIKTAHEERMNLPLTELPNLT